MLCVRTDCDLGVGIGGVGHRVEYGPVPVGGHGHQAEYGDGAQDDDERYGEDAHVQVTGQPDAGQHGARYAHQAHEQVGDGQRHDVVVGAPAEPAFPAERHDYQAVAHGRADGHQALEHGVRHVQPAARGRHLRVPVHRRGAAGDSVDRGYGDGGGDDSSVSGSGSGRNNGTVIV